MNRIPASEPNDEPVNRIAPFLSPQPNLPHDTMSSLLEGAMSLELNDSDRKKLEQRLKELLAKYEEDPHDAMLVKLIIIALVPLKEYQSAIQFGEYFNSLSATPDPMVEALIHIARKHLEARGGET